MIQISNAADTALKKDIRYLTSTIEIFFDESIATDITDTVIAYDVLEERSAPSDLPYGEISYNTLTLTLDNLDKRYSIVNANSPYNGKLKNGLKVVVKYFIETSPDIFEEIPGGIFYTDLWSSSNSGTTTTLTCYDRLFMIGNIEIPRFSPVNNFTVYQAYKLLLNSVSVLDTDIVNKITSNTVLPIFWGEGSTLIECLSNLAKATLTNIYVNKSNKIVVEDVINSTATPMILEDSSTILTGGFVPSYSNAHKNVRFKYKTLVTSAPVDVLSITGLVVEPGTKLLSTVAFNVSSVRNVQYIRVKSANTKLASYNYTDKHITMSFTNSGTVAEVVDISVIAYTASTVDAEKVIVGNNALSNTTLNIELPLVHSEQYLTAYGNTLLTIFNDYIYTLDLDIRALPNIELGDKIYVSFPHNNITGYFIVNSIHTVSETGLMATINLLSIS